MQSLVQKKNKKKKKKRQRGYHDFPTFLPVDMVTKKISLFRL